MQLERGMVETRARRRRDLLPTTVTVIALAAWSTLSYLTALVDADMVAEAIQVQQWMRAPFWVLTYPGQPYGGVLEYPLMLVAETIAPGDPYGFTLVRIAYVPIVGLLLCLNVRRLSPDWSLWPIALVAIAGPAVVHSHMAIKDLYPFSWLIGMVGVTVLYTQFAKGRDTWLIPLGGFVVGLGGYEHPTSLLFSVPMVVAGIVRLKVRGRRVINATLGLIVGLLVVLLQPARPIAYGTGQPGGPRLLEAFGLTQPSWTTAVVPDAWGVQFLDTNALRFPDGVQSVLNTTLALLAVVAILATVVVIARHARRGRPAPGYAYIATLWGSAVVVLAALTIMIRPIYFYGASLAVLVPLTLAALPTVLGPVPRRIVVAVVVAAMAVTSLGTLLGSHPTLPDSIDAKRQQAAAFRATAESIADAGIGYVLGSYWETLPVAYASQGRLHPLTMEANRFPLDPGLTGSITVAVLDGSTGLLDDQPRWPGSDDALALANAQCQPAAGFEGLPSNVHAVTCPVDSLRLD